MNIARHDGPPRTMGAMFGVMIGVMERHPALTLQRLALLTMMEGGPLSMREVAVNMGHSTAAATGLVDRLEQSGFVRRRHSAEDRREVLVEPTERGRQVLAELAAELRGELAAA